MVILNKQNPDCEAQCSAITATFTKNIPYITYIGVEDITLILVLLGMT